ncbi:Cytokinin dehydrogenase 1 [Cytospora mali]|uniref:Cytokinin dehydrogenase 1 n=1 Tax=Cytospora mali TaxID=578113 RepID=A0A194V6H9_CYTMA|nr:Cytokinin dehydrogenase 1 [Valsa mali var. pyri (nom. inval.)]
MTSQSVLPPSPPPWAEPLTTTLSSEPQFRERQVIYFPGSPEFADSENDYFNAAVREAQSVAVARPTSTADVSALLRILAVICPLPRPLPCAALGMQLMSVLQRMPGVSPSIVSLLKGDKMRGLRGVDVLAGDKHVRIAAGEKWHSVFAALESHKPLLTAVGGRSRNVGAIGSYLVVLASGEIITARRDDSKTADLWDALRGGSTNFGIVTAVEMSCFPHPAHFRGGTPFYLPSARQETLKALYRICTTYNNAKDDDFVAEADTKYLEEVAALARQMGLEHRYIFANYAWPTEPVMAGYGEERLVFLRKVAAKYDPKGFFQGQFVGGFKIGRSEES